MSALLRLLGSSTFWSALLSIVCSAIATKNGIPIDPIVTAAVPLAVGVKEAARHYGAAVAAKSPAPALQALAEAAKRLGADPLVPASDPRDFRGH